MSNSRQQLAFATPGLLSHVKSNALVHSKIGRRVCPTRVGGVWQHRKGQAASMSLVNELVIKGLEVSVATFLGNAVAGHQVAPPVREKTGLFGRKRRTQVTPVRPAAPDASRIVSEMVRIAETLPGVVERGGPEGKKWVKLAICIAIDLVGSGSLGVPLLGDALDLVTAPMSAVMLQALFGSSLVTIAGFTEEILPGTDGIPTATLAWLAEEYGYLEVEKGGDVESG